MNMMKRKNNDNNLENYQDRKEQLEIELNNLLIENNQNEKRKINLNNNIRLTKIIIKLLTIMICVLWCHEIFSYEIYSLFNKYFFSFVFIIFSFPIEKKLTKDFNKNKYEKLIKLEDNIVKNNAAIKAVKEKLKQLKEPKTDDDRNCQVILIPNITKAIPCTITGAITTKSNVKKRVRRKKD